MIRYIAKSSAKIINAIRGQKTVVKQAALADATGLNFLRVCTSAIEERGLTEPNLYRLTASGLLVNTLLQKGLSPPGTYKLKLTNKNLFSTRVITCAIKRYFRDLPEPLFPFRFYERLLNASKNPYKHSRLRQIKELVNMLPTMNYMILDCLIAHLERVTAYSSVNNMTAQQLAACFGPTLIRPEQPSTDATGADIKLCNGILETLITYRSLIFEDEQFSSPVSSRVATPNAFDELSLNESLHTPDGPTIMLDTAHSPSMSRAVYSMPIQDEEENDSFLLESYSSRAVAVHSFKGYFPSDIQININDIIENVRETSSPGWLQGTVSGRTGLFPSHFVRLIE